MISKGQLDFSRIRVLDGGMATELEQRGCDISGVLWSAHVLDSSPETIEAVHLDYLRAGADCILTASYQVSAKGYAELGRGHEDAAKALRRSVAIAEEARSKFASENNRPVWIAASLGPYGAALHNGAEYHGNYQIGLNELVEFHAERLDVLADTDADLVAFETVPSLQEAEAILVALSRYPGLTAWLSVTCKDTLHLAHGEQIGACAALLDNSPQIVAIGVNCTPPHLIRWLIEEIRTATAKPIVVYPNSGEIWNPAERIWQGKTEVERFGALAKRWFVAGAQAVGGCCRTGPAHIRAVREAFEDFKRFPA